MAQMTDGSTLLKNIDYSRSLAKIVQLPLPWEKLRGKRILVAGATGLIGSYLVDTLMSVQKDLKMDFTVLALGRNREKLENRFSGYRSNGNFRAFSQDITAKLNCELEDLGADFVFILASNTHPVDYATKPVSTILTNILGANNLLDYAARHESERVVYASSVEVYGENRGDTEKFAEAYCGYIDCNTLRACYPEGKRAGEALCRAYRAEKNLDIVIARLCRTYGETMQMSDTKAASQFIKNALEKQDIVLKSDGKQLYSYLHVADSVSALLYCLFYGRNGEAYNVADEKSDITLKEMADFIAKTVGVDVVFELPDQTEKAGFSKATKAVLDSAKLKSLGWNSMFDLQSGIKQTLNVLECVK
ncbi:MAG: NAD-dependent epimerase/dehydratase family protein [Treponema sp.]|nr:NAD-dependent epimerase/dehydratase family protein [Treponema sp.]